MLPCPCGTTPLFHLGTRGLQSQRVVAARPAVSEALLVDCWLLGCSHDRWPLGGRLASPQLLGPGVQPQTAGSLSRHLEPGMAQARPPTSGHISTMQRRDYGIFLQMSRQKFLEACGASLELLAGSSQVTCESGSSPHPAYGAGWTHRPTSYLCASPPSFPMGHGPGGTLGGTTWPLTSLLHLAFCW